jgi:hypothetical protein
MKKIVIAALALVAVGTGSAFAGTTWHGDLMQSYYIGR